MSTNRIAFYLIIGLFVLTGCGQKGPLYLPGNNLAEPSALQSQ